MADLLTQAKKLFGTNDLYQLFGVPRTANADKLKKAYYKISLKVHPDKITGKDKAQATAKFQLVSKLYKILSDTGKRQIYDKTGEIADEDDTFGLSGDETWMEYWRELFPPVTVNDIEKFHSEFKGSDEELSSLKAAYISTKGDIQKIINSVMCATTEDEQRFRSLLEPFIKSEEIPTFPKFSNESAAGRKKRLAKAAKEAKEADLEIKNLTKSKDNDLVLALQRNREKRGGILSYLETKYVKNNEDDSDDDLVINSKSSKRTDAGRSKRKSSTSSKASTSTAKRQKKS